MPKGKSKFFFMSRLLKPREKTRPSASDRGRICLPRSSLIRALSIFVAALLVSYFLCWMAESFLISRSLAARTELAEKLAYRPPYFANVRKGASVGIAESNPFGASRRHEKTSAPVSASALTLIGTLPRIGAWIRDDTGTHLVLKGQFIGGCRLEDIDYGRALLSKGGDSYPLYLTLSGGTASAPPPPRAQPAKAARDSDNNLSGIEPASEGREGAISRELIDKLVMNPYEEISKMRMVPVDGGGMQLQRIAPDSVLGLVGVSQGDIIKAINGVNISNLGDVANAVNSIVSGTRFDVTVERDGKPLLLEYQVK